LAINHGIPFVRDYAGLPLVPEEYSEGKVYGVLARYAQEYRDSLILYGGLATGNRVYGFKRIRSLSTDLDFVCTRSGLDKALSRERVFYHVPFDVFFAISENVPISLAFGHIHDWRIADSFYSSSRYMNLEEGQAFCASPEYVIMLKLRRMQERLDKGERPFGKDALDIINVLAAPRFRRDLHPVNVGELRTLINSEVTQDPARLKIMGDFIMAHTVHLTEREMAAFQNVAGAFMRGLAA
jgi:hypothetical protein